MARVGAAHDIHHWISIISPPTLLRVSITVNKATPRHSFHTLHTSRKWVWLGGGWLRAKRICVAGIDLVPAYFDTLTSP
jgi:hypothetical protein